MDIGSVSSNSDSILGVIGGISSGIAYALHKLWEGFVIGAFALLARSTSNRNMAILGLISGVPTLLGFFVGLPSLIESSYFFALGAAGAVYVEIKLLPVIGTTSVRYSAAVFVLIGFYLMYISGLFHG